MTDKKKHKPQYFRQLKDEITRVDANTWYARSESDPDKEPYLVFNSIHEGWICDCMAFVMNLEDNNKGKECKHILRIKKEYKL